MTREQHLYLKLIEECAEVQHIAAKVMQFGPEERWETAPPEVRGGTPVPGNNRQRLEEEVRHLLAVVRLLGIGQPSLAEVEARRAKIDRYFAYSVALGQVGP